MRAGALCRLARRATLHPIWHLPFLTVFEFIYTPGAGVQAASANAGCLPHGLTRPLSRRTTFSTLLGPSRLVERLVHRPLAARPLGDIWIAAACTGATTCFFASNIVPRGTFHPFPSNLFSPTATSALGRNAYLARRSRLTAQRFPRHLASTALVTIRV